MGPVRVTLDYVLNLHGDRPDETTAEVVARGLDAGVTVRVVAEAGPSGHPVLEFEGNHVRVLTFLFTEGYDVISLLEDGLIS